MRCARSWVLGRGAAAVQRVTRCEGAGRSERELAACRLHTMGGRQPCFYTQRGARGLLTAINLLLFVWAELPATSFCAADLVVCMEALSHAYVLRTYALRMDRR